KREVSGFPKKKPGVWQSLHPPIVTRYLPRPICPSSARAENTGRVTMDATKAARRIPACNIVFPPAFALCLLRRWQTATRPGFSHHCDELTSLRAQEITERATGAIRATVYEIR